MFHLNIKLLCASFQISHRYYRFVLVTVFAIEEINQNPNILPNITLGFRIYDSCYTEIKALKGTLWLLTGKNETSPNFSCDSAALPSAVIAELASKSSLPIATILALYRYPQISYGAVLPALSDKLQFPSFLRTVPRDTFQLNAFARLFTYFDWNWIGILASDNDLGRTGSQILKTEVERNGGCIAFLEIISMHDTKERLNQVIEVIKKSSANAIAVYTTAENLVPFMEETSLHNLSGKIWIGATSWSVSSDFSQKEILEMLNGMIGFAHEQGKIPGLQKFLYSIHPSKFPDDIFINTFWENAFNCNWLNSDNSSMAEIKVAAEEVTCCTGKENLKDVDVSKYDVNTFRFTYTTYNAIYAVANGLHKVFSFKPDGSFLNATCMTGTRCHPWQLHHFIKNVHFVNSAGADVYFDVNGDPPAVYDLLNWKMSEDGNGILEKVGSYVSSRSHGQELKVNVSAILWNKGTRQVPHSVCSEKCPFGYRKATKQGQPICCFDCVSCNEGEITNSTDVSDCQKCPEDQWPNIHRNQCILKVIQFLSYDDLLGAMLSATSACFSLITAIIFFIFIKYRDTPIVKANNLELSYILLGALTLCFLSPLIFIGHPRKANCLFRQVVFGIVFSICISSVLAKTTVVIVAFRATNPGSKLKKWLGNQLPYTIILFCSVLQVVICTVWLVTAPPFSEMNMKSESGKILILCNEGSMTAFWCMLGYLGFLASVSFLVAFFARNLPDSFNEAKYITFSMLIFVAVWISFIPAYLSTQGIYMVAVEVFAILCSSAGMLVCIFSPKCYIIVLRPEKNTRERLVGKVN
ncbi:LOW QUALITY PROTEIN: extracellular calcium-sensing receptor-like [Protopterus annectens]|uniref:LOW QUALITY PROTEIN: extracellular calcium-sensing receptor-like n=1 Tax=Protopterus annectens TaxID=7888 RepID=UPI001CFAD18D|nr:LOW QUALITY PROTEIN: extracellular calcium-sensing receptor-like [Protopterus annectens]